MMNLLFEMLMSLLLLFADERKCLLLLMWMEAAAQHDDDVRRMVNDVAAAYHCKQSYKQIAQRTRLYYTPGRLIRFDLHIIIVQWVIYNVILSVLWSIVPLLIRIHWSLFLLVGCLRCCLILTIMKGRALSIA